MFKEIRIKLEPLLIGEVPIPSGHIPFLPLTLRRLKRSFEIKILRWSWREHRFEHILQLSIGQKGTCPLSLHLGYLHIQIITAWCHIITGIKLQLLEPFWGWSKLLKIIWDDFGHEIWWGWIMIGTWAWVILKWLFRAIALLKVSSDTCNSLPSWPVASGCLLP